MIAGSRDILIVAPGGTVLGIVLGTILGLITGYFRGKVDDSISRIVDALMALPTIVVAPWSRRRARARPHDHHPRHRRALRAHRRRTVRSAVLRSGSWSTWRRPSCAASAAPYIIVAEILPNVMAPIIVETTVRLGYAVFTVAGLTFLGFGLQPPSPDWALQVSENYTTIDPNWWTVLFPGLAIASLVVAVNLIADGITQVVES